MSSPSRALRPSFTALALLLAVATPACGSDANSSDRTEGGGAPVPQPGSDGDAGGPKAPAVPGTPDQDSITEEKGIFVAPSGNDSGDGSRAHPLKTLGVAVTTAARVGKIVFACTGAYAEPLVVSDSISVIGGLDCADPLKWKTGAAPSRIQSPTSPAAIAKQITAATRLEALEIIAPDATSPGASSIGLLADHAPNLTIASSTITAGSGARGADGAAGVTLTLGPNATSPDSPPVTPCIAVTGSCGWSPVTKKYPVPSDLAGGIGQCLGAPGHDGGNGGAGGHAGLMVSGSFDQKTFFWVYYEFTGPGNYSFGHGGAGTSAVGAAGTDAPPAADFGSVTGDGYVPQNGNAGTDGHPGEGGSGGDGGFQGDLDDVYSTGLVERTTAGTGGGAGGCPGLAGGPGGGGGASLGVALVESPIVLDSVAIRSGAGGAAGLGSFGSDPTVGGAAGATHGKVSTPGNAGGSGGVAGVSTNGSNGPSIGILTSGSAPTLKGSSKATPGAGAKAIDSRTHTDGLNNTRSIPATPAGLSVDMKTL